MTIHGISSGKRSTTSCALITPNTLSDKAVEALAKFKGDFLGLNGLKTLSDKAAEALAKQGGCLLGTS